MKKIIEKFELDKNGTIGYMTDDDGYQEATSERGLYSQYMIDKLTAAGYKYLNYNGDIISPDGINIKDIAMSPCTLDEDGIEEALAYGSAALTEPEVAKYITRDSNVYEAIAFKTMDSYEIHTREELIDYVNKQLKLPIEYRDKRPINAIVDPNALFDINELRSGDPKVINACTSLFESRRTFTAWNQLEGVVKFLQDQGVLADKYTFDDIIVAYQSWGIDGIKSKCIEKTVLPGNVAKLNILNIQAPDTKDDSKEIALDHKIAYISPDRMVHFNGKAVPASEIREYGVDIKPDDWNKAMTTAMSENRNVLVKYTMQRATNKTVMKFIDDDGAQYSVRVDKNGICIRTANMICLTQNYVTLRDMYGTIIPSGSVNSESEYIRWNLTLAKIKDIIKSKIVKAPGKSSINMCIQEGVGPEAALAYLVDKHYEAMNKSIADTFNEYLSGDIKEYTIMTYNPDGLEYETIDDLIEIMISKYEEYDQEETAPELNFDETTEGRMSMGTNRNGESYKMVDKLYDISYRPVPKLDSIRRIKQGTMNTGAYADGIMFEGVPESAIALAELVSEFVNLSTLDGTIPTERINEATGERGLSVDSFLPAMRNSFNGYMRDKRSLIRNRLAKSNKYVFITGIYRELSNAPIAEQRHYMVSCNVFDASPKSVLKNAIYALVDEFRTQLKDSRTLLNYQIDIANENLLEIAALAIVRTVIGAAEDAITYDEGNNSYKFNLNLKHVLGLEFDPEFNKVEFLSINVPVSVINQIVNIRQQGCDVKYATLAEWCHNEYVIEDGFQYVALNAKITPWKVIPTGKSNIPIYNLPVNYYAKSTVLSDKFFSPSEIQQIEATGARVTLNPSRPELGLVNLFTEGSDLTMNFLDADLIKSTNEIWVENLKTDPITTYDVIMNSNIAETLDTYFWRWSAMRKYYQAKGQYLVSMPTQSDRDFTNYKGFYNVDPITECVTIPDPNGERDQFTFIKSYEVQAASESQYLLTAASTKSGITEFDLNNESFEDIARWTPILNAQWKPSCALFLVGKNLFAADGTRRVDLGNLSTMNRDDLDNLVDKDILYALSSSRYLIRTIRGDFCLEV